MSNKYYEVYLADVLKLAKSLVVKSEAAANALNKTVQLTDSRYTIPENVADWKYYQNMAGNYFYSDTNYLKDYNYNNKMFVIINKTIKILNVNYIDLEDCAYENELTVTVKTGNVLLSSNVDFIYNFTGAADGTTRLTFIGDYAVGGIKAFSIGDELIVHYKANNGRMIIKSIDTFEDIEFTKENLVDGYNDDRLIHKATADAYFPGSKYYNELVRRYPNQELLIRGIVTPVAVSISTAAEDHSILYYDKELVEENEITLIEKLQTWINKYFIRWDVSAYGLIDELYVPANLGIMWLQMPLTIMNLRLQACKTHEAHSYHIKQYLASHNKLDKYFDLMTKKQQLFLYRNIRYLQRNSGKTSNFTTLTEKILTDRSIPLNGWNLNHNLSVIGTPVDAGDPDNTEIVLTPAPETKYEAINDISISITEQTTPILTLLQKQSEIAKDNPEKIPEADQQTNWDFKTSTFNELKTKSLESTMIDYSEAQPYKFSDVILNHWLYLAWVKDDTGQPRYRSIITVKHPITNEEISLSALDAFIFFLYCFNKSTGNDFEGELITITQDMLDHQYIDLKYPVSENSIIVKHKDITKSIGLDYEVNYSGGVGGVTRISFSAGGDLAVGGSANLQVNSKIYIDYHYNGGMIPAVTARRVRRVNLPTKQELLNVVDSSVVDPQYTDLIIDNLVSIDTYISIEEFHDVCLTIFQQSLQHKMLFGFVEDRDIRAYVEQMVDMCYEDLDIELANNTSFDQWLSDKGISIEGIGRADWLNLANDILNNATGVVFNNKKSLTAIQTAMIDIMSKLSSYSVHFIRNMIDNIIIVDWLAIRFSELNNNYKAMSNKNIHIEDLNFDYNAKGYAINDLTTPQGGDEIDVGFMTHHNESLDPTVDIDFDKSFAENLLGYIPMAEFLSVDIKPYVPSGRWEGLPYP
jgi:hypothetical protein